MDTNRSWSIDDKRLNFQFGCEIGWEIKGGKRGRMLRNPTYTGIGPRFWALAWTCSAGPTSGRSGGRPTAARASRMQIGHTGPPGGARPGSPNVRVGVR